MSLIKKLDQFTRALGPITRVDAKQIVDAMNRRISELLGPSLIRLYWRRMAESGVILEPFAYIKKTGDEDPRPFEIADQPRGELSWVYHHKEALWLENIRDKGKDQAHINKASNEAIDPSYLDFRHAPDSMMVVPLISRAEVHGVYGIELPKTRPEKLTGHILEQLQTLSQSLALMLWTSDSYEFSLRQTSQAVTQFLDSISDEKIFSTPRKFSGFISRPFDDDRFSKIEDAIVKAVKKHESDVELLRYSPRNRQVVMEEIREQIRDSSFGIIDVTGTSPNVATEVGMLYALGKPFLLIKDSKDESPIPFSLAQYQVYRYRLKSPEGSLEVKGAGSDCYTSLESLLDNFLERFEY